MKKFAVLCAAGLAGAVAACAHSAASGTSRPDVPTVAVAPVTRTTLSQNLTIGAEFRAFQEIDLHAKVAGYLRTINVDVGDHVREGQLLAVLEVPELQDEMAQDEASIARADQDVNRAQADLDRAQSAYDVAHLSVTRLVAVSKERPHLIAQQDIDDASGRDRQAEAQVATAKAALAASRGQLDYAKANARKTQTLAAYTRITAPFTGVITRRYADKGAMIQSGTSSQTQTMPLVRLSQIDVLRLVIAVPESAVPSIAVKAPVSVRVSAIGRTFPGRIARLADRLDQDTRTMPVEVDVPNPTGELKPGMNAEATIVLKEARDVLTVPVEAVERGTGQARLLIVDRDHRVQARTVTLGLETATRAAVSGDLKPGDLVVIGNHDLAPGATVVPKAIATAPDAEKS